MAGSKADLLLVEKGQVREYLNKVEFTQDLAGCQITGCEGA